MTHTSVYAVITVSSTFDGVLRMNCLGPHGSRNNRGESKKMLQPMKYSIDNAYKRHIIGKLHHIPNENEKLRMILFWQKIPIAFSQHIGLHMVTHATLRHVKRANI